MDSVNRDIILDTFDDLLKREKIIYGETESIFYKDGNFLVSTQRQQHKEFSAESSSVPVPGLPLALEEAKATGRI